MVRRMQELVRMAKPPLKAFGEDGAGKAAPGGAGGQEGPPDVAAAVERSGAVPRDELHRRF